MPALTVVLIAVIGANLRAGLGATQPVVHAISQAYGIAGGEVGLVTGAVVLFIGLGAPFGSRVARTVGGEHATTIALGLIAVGGLMRLAEGSFVVFLVSSAVMGIGMGMGSVLAPSLVIKYVLNHRGLVLGIYVMSMGAGLVLGAAAAVPATELLGSWNASLALWGAVAGLTAIAWAVLHPRSRRSTVADVELTLTAGPLPVRNARAWLVTGYSAAGMVIGFGTTGWLAPYYLALGLEPSQAAAPLIWLQSASLIAMLVLPALTDRLRGRRIILISTMGSLLLGLALLIVAPIPQAIPAALLIGVGVGGTSAMTLVLVADFTHDHVAARRMNSMVMLVSYPISATAPVAVGLIASVTGSLLLGFGTTLVLAAIYFVTIPFLDWRRLGNSHRSRPPAR